MTEVQKIAKGMQVTRIHHPYTVWEDFRAGMYAPSSNPDNDAQRARTLLANPPGLVEAMADVVAAWPKAAQQFLTNRDSNRRSWLGQAACCYALGVPAIATRAAWWLLTEEQQELANAAADVVISRWDEEAGNAQTLFG